MSVSMFGYGVEGKSSILLNRVCKPRRLRSDWQAPEYGHQDASTSFIGVVSDDKTRQTLCCIQRVHIFFL